LIRGAVLERFDAMELALPGLAFFEPHTAIKGEKPVPTTTRGKKNAGARS
jgi:hypothetical protein